MNKFQRTAVVGSAALLATLGTSVLATTAQAKVDNTAHHYLALGDSLAQGVQPNTNGINVETDQGYTDDIYKSELASDPSLQLVKLGCPGETTMSFLHGGVCPTYTSQMAAAVHFLKLYGSQTSFVTIDIGANNVDNCASGGTINTKCLNKGMEEAKRQLPIILSGLQAADPGVQIFGMNYYDPFLAYYLEGTQQSQQLAELSIGLTQQYNGELDGIYSQHNVPVANVQDTPFITTDWSMNNGDTINGNPVPDDVFTLCALTYNCTPSPQGPNIHANPTGYQEIANEFLSIIPSSDA